jgi:hypothetical protein
MRFVFLLLGLIMSCGATLAFGLYAGNKQVWPVPQLRQLVGAQAQPLGRMDQFGRLLSYPGKIEITCPIQNEEDGCPAADRPIQRRQSSGPALSKR